MAKKVWCYTMTTQFGTPVYDIGSDDQVQVPKLHHLYECDPDSFELGNAPQNPLYYVSGFPIDVYVLQKAIRDFIPGVDCSISVGGSDGTLYQLPGVWYGSCTIFKGVV